MPLSRWAEDQARSLGAPLGLVGEIKLAKLHLAWLIPSFVHPA